MPLICINFLFQFRDLSQHIRDQVKIAFSKGEALNPVEQERCNRYYRSLKRLCTNQYGNRYKRPLNTTATGLTHDQCNLALTPEVQDLLKEESQGFLGRFINTFRRKAKNVN